MLGDLLEYLGEFKNRIIHSRLFVLGIVYALCILVMVSKLYDLQIVKGEDYQTNYIQMTEKTVTTTGTRGNIYDVNGVLLAYNELTNDVVIQDGGEYKTSNDRNRMILRLIKILIKHDQPLDHALQIGIDDDGEYVYTSSSETARLRFLRDVYGLKSVDELDDAKGQYPSDAAASDIVEMLVSRYDIDELEDDEENEIEITDVEKLYLVDIRYAMSLTSYQRYEKTTVASSVTDTCKADILENAGELLGVSVDEVAKRVYNYSEEFSSIIGYIGKVQEDQLEDLYAIDENFTVNDVAGRTGIELYMEEALHGMKGSTTMYVDNVGRIKEIKSQIDPQSGSDVYLSIDWKLQVGIYHLLEQHLAGILDQKIVNEENPNENISDASKLLIPIKDAYFQLINNNVLSTEYFAASDASENEKSIYAKYENYKNTSINEMYSELMNENAASMQTLPEDINEYMQYIYTYLSDESIIQTDKINQSVDYVSSWRDGSISLRDMLYHGIADDWIDTTKLSIPSKYADASDIYALLIEHAINGIQTKLEFVKMLYKYMIKQNTLTGNELCIALYDQGILEYDGDEIEMLKSAGVNYAYVFLKAKIRSLEITPAQLALDPCTAGCVVTDVNTGKIKALVSYPSYDNNKLTNTMDVAYYNSLIADGSLPLYNNATQAKKAPGSTFKPITVIAALEEGAVGLDETIECTGIYDTIDPAIRCWIYPGKHSHQNVIGALRNSCNFFCNEVAHRLSTDENGEYSATLGMNAIQKYATMFGLDHKSGVEITESEPNISDESPEQSSIGQGTHSYTNVQLSRYVTAIANKGNIYELSIIDKIVSTDEEDVAENEPQISSTVNIADSTWDAVHTGMREVVIGGSAKRLFSDLEVDIAGKTGTTQESRSRGNHAFFISFGPYTSPDISVVVNIPYGYSSSHAAAVAKDVYRLNYGYTNIDYVLNTGAQNATGVEIGD